MDKSHFFPIIFWGAVKEIVVCFPDSKSSMWQNEVVVMKWCNLLKYLIKNYGSYSILYFKYIFCLTEALFCFVKKNCLKVTICRKAFTTWDVVGGAYMQAHLYLIFKWLNTTSTYFSFCKSGTHSFPHDPHCIYETVMCIMFSAE